MDFSTILMIVGIICIVLSFFLKDNSKKVEKDLEELSISIFQETNAIKRRLKVVEEELLLEPSFQVKSPKVSNEFMEAYKQIATTKQAQMSSIQTNSNKRPINEILVRQVIELNKQGYPIDQISKMSTLSEDQIMTILHNNGGNQ